MGMSGWRRPVIASLASALTALLVAAGALEVWVRLAWNPHKGTPGFFLSDARRGQRLAADYDGWFAGVPVHINSLELRDPREYELKKRPNTFRILVLGDSVTFGHGSVYEHTYPYLTERRLKAWRPDIDWQVWNASVPGYNTSQELAQLLEVGDRYQPDLVIVGFFDNDLSDNRPLSEPGRLRTGATRVLSFARRHVYSLEFYKQAYLTGVWRLSGSDEYRRRVEHLGIEESLLARGSDVSGVPEQQLTAFERLTDEQVSRNICRDGMRVNESSVSSFQHDPRFQQWIGAVRGFQRLNLSGRFRIMFMVNNAPPSCTVVEPAADFFYDGGSRLFDRLYLRILGDGTPAVSSYDAFLHTRPSQMPYAAGHSIGNANVVKTDVLFGFLRDCVLPKLIQKDESAR
jgi:GDSL-like lipase/acylhydrolase family protein